MAAIAVGAYFVLGGGSGSGSDIADDGAHKLTTPATVVDDTYKKSDGADASDGMTSEDKADFEKWGVQNPKDVSAGYEQGSGLTVKNLSFSGAYGTIDDPEAVVDAMFAKLKTESEKNQSGDDTTGKMIGSPEQVTPTGFSNGIMKCQVAEITNNDTSATDTAKTLKMPMCIWGDHSTVAVVTAFSYAELISGGGSIDDTASLAAKIRNDVRVKA